MSNSALLGEQLSPEAIARIVYDAGDVTIKNSWHGVNAVAIALAESGGYTMAININATEVRADGTTNPAYLSMDLGLWQVNTYWHNLTPPESFDPATQVAYVLGIAKKPTGWGYNWNLWATWQTSNFYGHLSTALKAYNAIRVEEGLLPL